MKKSNARRLEEIRAKLALAAKAVEEFAIEIETNGNIEDLDNRGAIGCLERKAMDITRFALNHVMDVDALIDEFTLAAESIVNETETTEAAYETMIGKMLK